MLTVTAPAKELLRTIDTPDERSLRLDPGASGQLDFVAGPPRPDDQVVEESGQELLRIAGEVSQQLDGHNLDRVETPEGPRFSISRPDQPVPVG
jgi:Fe-S cluster assembly iron-binding protein IscA